MKQVSESTRQMARCLLMDTMPRSRSKRYVAATKRPAKGRAMRLAASSGLPLELVCTGWDSVFRSRVDVTTFPIEDRAPGHEDTRINAIDTFISLSVSWKSS